MASLTTILARKSNLLQKCRPWGIMESKALLRTSTALKGGLIQDHGKMWNVERAVSALQIPAFVVPFAYTTPMTDAIFCTLAVLHAHWGVEAVVVDYIRPSLFGGSKVIPNLCQVATWILSAAVLGGLFYFNYTDIGFVNAMKMIWML
uniref:Succinate dehydrogenase [ubiquinone] cytochrome b small subunit n=1 Tax=Lepeophtheirus salmonis TaxID=72036 RepID=C1BUX9_LEPSM|nr:succinate dehydrogenase cytochrome b small subunit, mitochondrial precursor [Lepeophtheirus salmonis]